MQRLRCCPAAHWRWQARGIGAGTRERSSRSLPSRAPPLLLLQLLLLTRPPLQAAPRSRLHECHILNLTLLGADADGRAPAGGSGHAAGALSDSLHVCCCFVLPRASCWGLWLPNHSRVVKFEDTANAGLGFVSPAKRTRRRKRSLRACAAVRLETGGVSCAEQVGRQAARMPEARMSDRAAPQCIRRPSQTRNRDSRGAPGQARAPRLRTLGTAASAAAAAAMRRRPAAAASGPAPPTGGLASHCGSSVGCGWFARAVAVRIISRQCEQPPAAMLALALVAQGTPQWRAANEAWSHYYSTARGVSGEGMTNESADGHQTPVAGSWGPKCGCVPASEWPFCRCP